MFGLFKKKEATIRVKDKVWMTESVKLKTFFTEGEITKYCFYLLV